MPNNVSESPDTRQRIKDSLLRILASDPKSKVSIKEIAFEAGINRGTFYIHYKDFDALLNEIEEDALGEIRSTLDKWEASDKITHRQVIKSISDLLDTNRDIFKIFLIYDSKILPQKVRDLMKLGYQIFIKKNNLRMSEKEIEITISAVYGILNDWAVNESPYGIHEFNKYLLGQMDKQLERK
jgi:AcrR family transcriptional regulator